MLLNKLHEEGKKDFFCNQPLHDAYFLMLPWAPTERCTSVYIRIVWSFQDFSTAPLLANLHADVTSSSFSLTNFCSALNWAPLLHTMSYLQEGSTFNQIYFKEKLFFNNNVGIKSPFLQQSLPDPCLAISTGSHDLEKNYMVALNCTSWVKYRSAVNLNAWTTELRENHA